MTKNNLTIEDIHEIRYKNYEQTKKLSSPELIKRTKENASAGWQRIEKMRKDRENKSSAENGCAK